MLIISLQNMSQPAKKPDSSTEPEIDTDTFWELIEKLLLHSSTDERTRIRHNLSLSALCKSQALPPLPRPKRPEVHVKKSYRRLKHIEQKEENKNEVPNSVKRNAKSENITKLVEKAIDKVNDYEGKYEISEIRNEIQNIERAINKTNDNDTKFEISDLRNEMQNIEKYKVGLEELRRQSPDNATPYTTKSECSLNDLRVQLVKDANAPPSERLWRFAMRNKKRTDDNNAMRASPISKARSNEAIYRGLKERLDEIEREAKGREEKIINTTEGTNREPCAHEKKPKERRNKIKLQPVSVKQSQPKRHNCPAVKEKGGQHVPYRQTPSMMSLRSQNVKSKPRTPIIKLSRTPFGATEVPEITALPVPKQTQPLTKQDFDERRALYDSILKKRLRCGCKLESLNNEMLNRNYSRSVLNGETTKKYVALKSEYLSLCHKESQLKHQIALLNAEIYMMQNKGYHKTPAAVKTITLDSKTPLYPESESCLSDRFPLPPVDAPFFPPLKPRRPHLQTRPSQERMIERYNSRFEQTKQRLCNDREYKLSSMSQTSNDSLARLSDLSEIEDQRSFERFQDIIDDRVMHASVCSTYSLDSTVAPPQQHELELVKENKVKQEESLIKLFHRLPKLKPDRSLCNQNKY